MRFLRRPSPPAGKAHRGDPLAAVPRVAPEVEVRVADDGTYHVRKAVPSPGNGGFLEKLTRSWKRESYVNLDKNGTDFWKKIDGETTLGAIADTLSSEWDLDRTQCRRAVIQFTRSLMTRNLIVLEVSADTSQGDSA